MVSLEANERETVVAIDTDVGVEDEEDDSVAPVRYGITSFGVDFDVEGLYRRIRRGEIVIPSFQRSYVLESPAGVQVHRIPAARLADSRNLLVTRLRLGQVRGY